VERGSHNVYKTNAVKLLGTPLQALRQFTTPVPSSAAVERLFGQGKDILKGKRASLAGETFKMLMFMRGNKHHFLVFLKNKFCDH
jgi:hypothetical protein